jgi:hypothetical protein
MKKLNGTNLPLIPNELVSNKKGGRFIIKHRVFNSKEELLKRTTQDNLSSLYFDISEKTDPRVIFRDMDQKTSHILSGMKPYVYRDNKTVLVQDYSGKAIPIGTLDPIQNSIILNSVNFSLVKPAFIRFRPYINANLIFSYLRDPAYSKLVPLNGIAKITGRLFNNLGALVEEISTTNSITSLAALPLVNGVNNIGITYEDKVGNKSVERFYRILKDDTDFDTGQFYQNENVNPISIENFGDRVIVKVNIPFYKPENKYKFLFESLSILKILNQSIDSTGLATIEILNPLTYPLQFTSSDLNYDQSKEIMVLETSTLGSKKFLAYIELI